MFQIFLNGYPAWSDNDSVDLTVHSSLVDLTEVDSLIGSQLFRITGGCVTHNWKRCVFLLYFLLILICHPGPLTESAFSSFLNCHLFIMKPYVRHSPRHLTWVVSLTCSHSTVTKCRSLKRWSHAIKETRTVPSLEPRPRCSAWWLLPHVVKEKWLTWEFINSNILRERLQKD